MSRILGRPIHNVQLSMLGKDICQKFGNIPQFSRRMKVLYSKHTKCLVKGIHGTYQQKLAWKYLKSSPNLVSQVCHLSSSPTLSSSSSSSSPTSSSSSSSSPYDEKTEHIKNDPETLSFLKQLREDFGVKQEASQLIV